MSADRDGIPARVVSSLSFVCTVGIIASSIPGASLGATGEGDDQYLVFPPPLESPADGPQTLVVGPADGAASPFGWHDTNGDVDPDFTDTRGNNVFAQEDVDANNTGGTRPDGGPGSPLDFRFAFDPELQPDEGQNLEAGVTNLFFWNNYLHDLMWRYGFDEGAGNFQFDNYGNGGNGNDPVLADAQDGAGTNGANFSTPPDGISPRMQMFLWTPQPVLAVNSPGSIMGEYTAGSASFGAALDSIGVTGDLELVEDADDEGGSGSVSDACQPLVGFTPGRIAVIDRGACDFSVKVLHAEEAGAAAAVVVNHQGDGVLDMGAGSVGDLVSISSVFIGQSDGERIQANLPGVNATLLQPSILRDGALDNGIIAHEYGHGVSNRLTGGPTTVSCLANDEQGGEGWSDFWTLALTAKATDTPTLPRGIGTYLIFQDPDGPGVRTFPYTTDLALNPLTFGDVATANVPHGVGQVWASLLWEVYWEMVLEHGFDPDFVNGSGGNNLTLQLMIDGLKLQPCNPTFVGARDAILIADQIHNGGENRCEIWRAFAKRGLGAEADSGTSGTGDESEDFSLPEDCNSLIFADGFESAGTEAWSSVSP